MLTKPIAILTTWRRRLRGRYSRVPTVASAAADLRDFGTG